MLGNGGLVSNCFQLAISHIHFVLVVLGYVIEEPYVVPRVQPLTSFAKGEKPQELMVFDNIGKTPAYSFTSGIAIAILPYPLGRVHLTEVPSSSMSMTIYPAGTIGSGAVQFREDLSDSELLRRGAGRQTSAYLCLGNGQVPRCFLLVSLR